MKPRAVALAELRTDGGTQPRAYTDHQTVSEYVEAMKGGAEFPPIIVFDDGESTWVADGFHRMLAAHELGHDTIAADVRKGTLRDAVLYSVGANAAHGKPRTNADKRHAVTVLLKDPEWARRSDCWIAESCKVSNHLVATLRAEHSENSERRPPAVGARVRVDRRGRRVDTARQGSVQGSRPAAVVAETPPAPAAPVVSIAIEAVWTSISRLSRRDLEELRKRLNRLLEMQA